MSDPADFYDQLAPHYHLVYRDWHSTIRDQAEVLDTVIRDRIGPGSKDILDCACGIGTQTIGLSSLGHKLTASDISPAAVERAQLEVRSAGLSGVRFEVAGFLSLRKHFKSEFDVVLACDNSLPHVLTEAEMGQALDNFRQCLKGNGLLLISIRDYDHLLKTRPEGTIPREDVAGDNRRITFQVWRWISEEIYDLELFLLTETSRRWTIKSMETRYRAWQREALDDLLTDGGFQDISWHFPPETGYYQPILTARVGG